jgi:hypothetical protein
MNLTAKGAIVNVFIYYFFLKLELTTFSTYNFFKQLSD